MLCALGGARTLGGTATKVLWVVVCTGDMSTGSVRLRPAPRLVSDSADLSLGPGQPKRRLGGGGGELYPGHAVEHSVGLDDLEALDHLDVGR